MDGHFIRGGYGDGSQESEVEPIEGALGEAEKVLGNDANSTVATQIRRVEKTDRRFTNTLRYGTPVDCALGCANENAQSSDEAIESMQSTHGVFGSDKPFAHLFVLLGGDLSIRLVGN